MTPPNHRCLLGAIGWEHPDWIGPFYPEDMPPEWRLSYYNTAFECVFLPYAMWHHAPLDTLAQWRYDTLERFRFLLEAPLHGLSPEDAARIDALDARECVVSGRDGPCVVWLEPGADLKQLAARLTEALARQPVVYLVSVSGDLAQLEQARTLIEVLGY